MKLRGETPTSPPWGSLTLSREVLPFSGNGFFPGKILSQSVVEAPSRIPPVGNLQVACPYLRDCRTYSLRAPQTGLAATALFPPLSKWAGLRFCAAAGITYQMVSCIVKPVEPVRSDEFWNGTGGVLCPTFQVVGK